MTERPIIFSAPMVRVILEGRKNQTRRVVKPQPSAGVRNSPFVRSGLEDGHGHELRCPYGQPGNRLWVRETFASWHGTEIFSGRPWPCTAYRAGRSWLNGNRPDYAQGEVFWKAPDYKPEDVKWKPAIHMSRGLSRILLEITDVRVQRVQEISEADARAEGVLWAPGHGEIEPVELYEGYSNYLNCREGFQVLWDSINERRGFGWNVNPWTWALTFKRVDEATDSALAYTDSAEEWAARKAK